MIPTHPTLKWPCVFDEDILHEVVDHGLAMFRRHQSERQRQDVGRLRLALVGVGLRIEERLVEGGPDLLRRRAEMRRILGLAQATSAIFATRSAVVVDVSRQQQIGRDVAAVVRSTFPSML